jgi:uncharacterized membrane protein YfcA
MSHDPFIDGSLLALAGLLVGTTVGLTGVGSGSLMTPVLVLLVGQPPSVAVGTDLVFAAVTKLVATGSFAQSRRIDWGIVWRLTLGSLPAAGAMVLWLYSTRQEPGFLDQAILHYLGVILAIGALVLLLQEPLRRFGLKLTASGLHRNERYTQVLTMLSGLILGIAVTLTSVGAGTLGVVILLCLYPLRLAPDRLVATDIAQALPVTLLAATGHMALGHLDLHVLGTLLLGSIPGVWFASRAAIRLPPALTRTLIGIMLAFVSQRMLFAR